MSDTEYISDSEDDALRGELLIDQNKFADILSRLSPRKQELTRHRLERLTNVSYVNRENNTRSARLRHHQNNEIRNTISNRIEDSDDDSDLNTIDLIRNLPRRSNNEIEQRKDSTSQHQSQNHTVTQNNVDNTVVLDDQENEHHLQSYLNTTTSYVTWSGRSLRKRNFASTHPYLADQAHYLGLSDVDYLNEIYEENDHNLEKVVKYLNYNYERLKKRYPKDEKYRSKNFYTIISRQSHLAREKELQEEQITGDSVSLPNINDEFEEEDDEGNKEFTIDPLDDLNSQIYETDESSNEPDDFLQPVKHHRLVIPDDDEDNDTNNINGNYYSRNVVDEESGSGSDSDSSKSDIYVRVGGRFRKEKNALKGVLPESAKRLSIYQPGSKRSSNRHLQKSQAVSEYRKGMALRKRTKRKISERDDFTGFVDDTITYDTNNELYHELYDQPVVIEEQTPSLSYPSFESVTNFSESSASEDEDKQMSYESDLDIFDVRPREADIAGIDEETRNVDDNEELDEPLDYEVREGDYINHMLATAPKSKSTRSKRQSTGTTATMNTSSRRTYKSQKRSIAGMLSRSKGARGHSTKGDVQRSDSSTVSVMNRSTPSRRRQPKARSTRVRSDDSYSRLPVKRITSLQHQRSKKTTASTRKLKKRKDTLQLTTLDNYIKGNPRDIFADNYLFSRSPILSTTIVEAESVTRFVKETYKNVNPSAPQIAPSIILGSQPIFEFGCILNDIVLDKITALGDGKFYQIYKDSVTIEFLGETVVLTLIDHESSKARYEKLLIHLARLFKSSDLSNESLIQTFYTTIKGILEWNLILQERPTERNWKLAHLVLSNIIDSPYLTASSIRFILPYFFLVGYTMNMIAKLNGKTSSCDLNNLGMRYWQLFFETFSGDLFESMNFEAGSKSKEAESYFILCRLLEESGVWWTTIVNALQVYKAFDVSLLLESVFCLCVFARKGYSWEPLQLVYQMASAEETLGVEFYYRYLEIVYFMNQRNNWPLPETVVLQIYSSITKMKFANFIDEIGMPDLIGKVSTRFDIPDDSFFERFMQLLYWYISGLSEPSKVKKLVTKLFTFSKFQYVNDQNHHVMFINRLNFILLLASVSKVDLKTQLLNLLEGIMNAKDAKLIKLASKGVCVLTEIAIQRDTKLPIEGISIVIQCCVNGYYSVHGVLKVWKNFLTLIKDLFHNPLSRLSHSLQLLNISKSIDINNIPDKIIIDICRILSDITSSMINAKDVVVQKHIKTITSLNEFVVSLLHRQMGRLPLPSVMQENRVSGLIEILLSMWVQCAFILGESWERLILQTYAYTGNQQSREQFALYFYSKILQFNNLQGCKELVTRQVLRDLVCFNPSKYLFSILQKLQKERWGLFSPGKMNGVTLLMITNSRHVVVSNILQNLAANSSAISIYEYQLYVKDILRTLNIEFEKYYSSLRYKTFCINVIKDIQKYCEPTLINESLLANLASKLGISENELSHLKIQKLPLKEKLKAFVGEFLNSVYFGGDYIKILEKFTFEEGVELIYHLVSVLLQEMQANSDFITWKVIYLLLKFFDENLRLFKFKFINLQFKHFLKSLVELPKVRQHNTSTADQYYRICCLLCITSILRYCKIIFEGYTDLNEIECYWVLFSNAVHSYNPDKSRSLEFVYSSFGMQELLNDFRFPKDPNPQDDISQESLQVAHRVLVSEIDLIDTTSGEVPDTCILDYDFNF
ncbi:conserved hypothetical protein [Candida dubliniensis CD36]|uniref:Mms22p n=1 Tax=Candida dubliniensis (strain CD36 / ATCC MYA-646 / CBS 7987 / NCPF 3949 / NRRL Y-17841) TaxID=573826 RepID=B9WKN9_CANDC|nr:conserved hypothetical protein [Candida dubliniensis CD36]CAX39587.1 conserved hypothetical protein [Candida dubliniensis CD36]